MTGEVFGKEKVLSGKIVLSQEDLGLRCAVLLKYYLGDVEKSVRNKVSRIVHGYTSREGVEGGLSSSK